MQGKESSRLKELENHKEKIKDIETIEETHKRVKKVVNYLLKNYYGKRVLIITHGAFQSILINHLLGEEITKKQKTGNTAITIFKFSENKKPELVLLNCDKHLE